MHIVEVRLPIDVVEMCLPVPYLILEMRLPIPDVEDRHHLLEKRRCAYLHTCIIFEKKVCLSAPYLSIKFEKGGVPICTISVLFEKEGVPICTVSIYNGHSRAIIKLIYIKKIKIKRRCAYLHRMD